MPRCRWEDFERINEFHYIIIRTQPKQQNPWPQGHEFHKFGRELNAYSNYASILTAWCPGIKKEDFGKNCIFSIINAKFGWN